MDTKTDENQTAVKDSESRAGASQRLKAGILDEHYIKAYLQRPMAGKTAALREAIKAAGVNMNATGQRAYEIHNRLRDRIDSELIKLAKDAKALGLNKLVQLCNSAESENVQLSAATTLTKDLFPNVTLKKTETIEEMESELAELRNKRESVTGKIH